MTTKTRRKVAPPDTTGLSEVICANPECDKFIGYADIKVGLFNIKCHRCKTNNLNYAFTTKMPKLLTADEITCKHCDRFLYLSAVIEGTIVVKCRICKEWDILHLPLDKHIPQEAK